MPALLARLMINLAVPVLVFVLLRPLVHSDITALIAGAAVPTACTASVLLWRRRLDVIGVFAVGCFVIGLLLVVVTGGNELVFKLREDIWTGPLGLACLISAAAGRPLFFVALRFAARRNAQIAVRTGDPQARRISTVTTGVIGVILLVHALVMVALALTTSTTIFLAVKLPVSLAIVGGGLAALVCWIRHQYPSRWNRPPNRRAAGPAGSVRQHEPGSSAERHGLPPMEVTHPHRQGKRGKHAHRHDPQNRHHQRADRRGVAQRAG
jgi:drug/metabolite transporter (DMT)-like permease